MRSPEGASRPDAGNPKREARRAAASLALGYIALAALWIAVTDQLGVWLSLTELVWYQTAKGLFFVVATGALFFWAMRRRLLQLLVTRGALRGANQELSAKVAQLLQAQAELRNQGQQFELALEASAAGVWEWDIEQGTAELSPRLRAILDLPDDLLVNWETWQLWTHPEDLPRLKTALAAHLEARDKGVFDVEYRLRSGQGSYLWCRVMGLVEYGPEGAPRRMTGSLFDISAQKAAQHQLQKANERLEAAVAERTVQLEQAVRVLERSNDAHQEFASIISHDLKAPLRGIKNLVQFLLDDLAAETSPETRENLRLLAERSTAMQHMLDGLREYCRASTFDSDLAAVDLSALLRDVVALTEPPATFTVVLPEGLPRLRTYAVPLRHAFGNLLSNAVKHHDKPNGRIEVGFQSLGDAFELTVCDDGPGIDPKHQHDIFLPFRGFGGKHGRGDGMGLAIVRKQAQAVGGEIKLDPSPGRGARFTLRWPGFPCLPPQS